MPPNGRGKAYAYGHITNAIENGHRVRMAEVESERRRAGRSRMLAVDGRFFYDSAEIILRIKVPKEIEKFVQYITGELR